MSKETDFALATLSTVKHLANSSSLKAAALPIIDQVVGYGISALTGKTKIPDAKERIAGLVRKLAVNDAKADKALAAKKKKRG